MKLKDVLVKLEAFDPELDLLCYSEDEGGQKPNNGFKLFEITDVTSSDAEKTRLADGTPALKFGKSGASATHVFFHITADF